MSLQLLEEILKEDKKQTEKFLENAMGNVAEPKCDCNWLDDEEEEETEEKIPFDDYMINAGIGVGIDFVLEIISNLQKIGVD